jgi:hypothetical protein
VIGYVKQAWSVCVPKFKIQNAQEETVLLIEGPCFTCSICGDVEFQVSISSFVSRMTKVSKTSYKSSKKADWLVTII